MEQSLSYYERLEKIHIYLNRILGSLLQDSIPEDKKEIYIAIQYIKDADRAINNAEVILYKNNY